MVSRRCLLRQITVQEGHDLAPGADDVGREGGGAAPGGDTLVHGPNHGLGVPGHIGKGVFICDGRAARQLPQIGNGGQTGARGVSGKAVGQALFQRPVGGVGVILPGGNRRVAPGRGRGTIGPPQEGQNLRRGAGNLGGEGVAAGAGGDTLLHGPGHGVGIVRSGSHVGETGGLAVA